MIRWVKIEREFLHFPYESLHLRKLRNCDKLQSVDLNEPFQILQLHYDEGLIPT